MRIIIDLTQVFREAKPVWKAYCPQFKYKTMATTKREALVLMAKRIIRITNEELQLRF
jgi:hypothetical protein